MAKSDSDSWRERGNQLYRDGLSSGLSPILKKERLVKSITAYDKAIQTSQQPDQKASATKNHAKASWATAVTAARGSDLCTFYYRQAIQHFTRAVSLGREVKEVSWVDSLILSYRTCLDEALQAHDDQAIRSRSAAIQGFISVMEDDLFVSETYQELATVLFHHAVTSLDKGDFRSSLHSLKETYRPIQEMTRFGRGSQEVITEARVLEADVFMTTASAESLQAIITGDELLKKTLSNEENLPMSMVYEVIDWYKKAILHTREVDVEREAIAACRLGKLYDQVLKLKYKAKDYFMLSLELAHSLSPRVFTTVDWFRLAADTVEKYQKESVQYQEQQERKEKQKYMDELKEEREKLSEAYQKFYGEKGKLLFFVYSTFPPKAASFTAPSKEALEKMDDKEIKKAFLKAILSYHPDKQKQESRKWQVFSEEITKVLTCVYEGCKLGSY